MRAQPGAAGERSELLKRGEELGCPGPGALQVELGAASGERQAPGDVQQLVAQALGLGLGECAFQQQRLGPDEQVVGEHHYLEPYLVQRELLERELREAGVLVIADAILDVGVLAVAALDARRCPFRPGR